MTQVEESMTADPIQFITELYSRQLALEHDPYLTAHSRTRAGIRRHVDVFHKYEPYLRPGKILDWGCRQAVDACLIRRCLGDSVELFGCDIEAPHYPVFHDYARLQHTQLDHPFKLPYPDDEFDTVVGSGVLEHVPQDADSLKELHRVIKPGGHLIITFLPNRTSYTEFFNRKLKRCHHSRLYSRRGIRSLLLQHGFELIRLAYHQVTPSLAGENPVNNRMLVKMIDGLYGVNALLERVPILRRLAANLMAVSLKRVDET